MTTFSDPLGRTTPGSAVDENEVEQLRAARSGTLPTLPEDVFRTGTDFSVVDEELTDKAEPVEVDEFGHRVRAEFNPPEDGRLEGASNGLTTAQNSGFDLVRALLNRAPEQSLRLGPDPRRPRRRDSHAAARGRPSILAGAFDEGLQEIVTTVLQPEVSNNGFVEFSFAGLGTFALMFAESTGSIFLLDVEGGSAFKVYQSPSRATHSGRPTALARTGTVATATGTRNNASDAAERNTSHAIANFILFVKRTVVPVVTSPITLAVFGLFGMLWLVWRVSVKGA